jgi:hypothetical protein
MTRAKSFALAAALVAVVSGMAHAASPITLKCISAESQKLRLAIATARTGFRTGRAACFGPGQQCALQCQANNDSDCALAIAQAITDCNTVCSDAQKKTIDGCRSDFVNGKLTQAQLDMCANAARQTGLDCKLACTDAHDEDRLACSQSLSACLGHCASCGSTDPCPNQ